MYHLSLFFALLISATGAIPVEDSPFSGAIKWTPNHQIQASDVIVPIKGFFVKEEAYLAKLKAEGIKIGAPKLDPSWTSYSSTNLPKPRYPKVTKGQLGKRDDCVGTFYITTDKTETFVDWDVQMSPVVYAVGDMGISVSSGYSVSNTVGGSAGVDLTFVKDKLAGSLGIDYSRIWTTLTSVFTKATIKDGQCGVMITKPLTTRRSGRQFRGCIRSATEIGTWYADSRGEGSYNDIILIEGAISACAKPGSNLPCLAATEQEGSDEWRGSLRVRGDETRCPSWGELRLWFQGGMPRRKVFRSLSGCDGAT